MTESFWKNAFEINIKAEIPVTKFVEVKKKNRSIAFKLSQRNWRG